MTTKYRASRTGGPVLMMREDGDVTYTPEHALEQISDLAMYTNQHFGDDVQREISENPMADVRHVVRRLLERLRALENGQTGDLPTE